MNDNDFDSQAVHCLQKWILITVMINSLELYVIFVEISKMLTVK